MALILCLETATEVCSVALFLDEKLVGIRESSARNVHSAMLTTFIDELIKASDFSLGELDAIAVSMGPGSYTGLRIGVATAKGLCYALDKPLIAVPTLQAMAAGINYELRITNYESGDESANRHLSFVIRNSDYPVLFCPMLDARRMEVYCAVFDETNTEVQTVRAEIIDEFSFRELLQEHVVFFGGEGAAKCKPLLENHPNAFFPNGIQASASFMISIAANFFKQQRFENLAYFEPFYLKDFIAGKPRVKGLRS